MTLQLLSPFLLIVLHASVSFSKSGWLIVFPLLLSIDWTLAIVLMLQSNVLYNDSVFISFWAWGNKNTILCGGSSRIHRMRHTNGEFWSRWIFGACADRTRVTVWPALLFHLSQWLRWRLCTTYRPFCQRTPIVWHHTHFFLIPCQVFSCIYTQYSIYFNF